MSRENRAASMPTDGMLGFSNTKLITCTALSTSIECTVVRLPRWTTGTGTGKANQFRERSACPISLMQGQEQLDCEAKDCRNEYPPQPNGAQEQSDAASQKRTQKHRDPKNDAEPQIHNSAPEEH